MQSKVAPYAATPEPTYGRLGQGAPQDQGVSRQTTPEEADLRLVIEWNKASNTYVYKTINRQTGEVVLQLPREEVLRLHEDTAYAAGGVIRAKA